MNNDDETKIRKINIASKAKVERKNDFKQNKIKKAELTNRSVFFIFLFVAVGGYVAFYIWDKNFRNEVVVAKTAKPKKSATKEVKKIKALPEPAVQKIDLSSIILSSKCFESSVKPICKSLTNFRSRSGVEGATSIASTLYISINANKSLYKLKSLLIKKEEEKEILDFYSKNYYRKMHPLKFKANDFVYKQITSKDISPQSIIISDYIMSKIPESLIRKFDEIFLVSYAVDKGKVVQNIVINEKVDDFLKKIKSISVQDIKLYFHSGLTEKLDRTLNNFKTL